ncbi:MAG: hypothetical protein R3B68_08320 [Phycisphaerales bacterium]
MPPRNRRHDRCVQCRYDLAGLTPPGSCPECGLELSRAMIGCKVDDWSDAHLRAVARWLLPTWAIPGGLLIAGPLWMMGLATRTSMDAPIAAIAAVLTSLIATLCSCVAWTRVLARDSSPCPIRRWIPATSTTLGAAAAVSLIASGSLLVALEPARDDDRVVAASMITPLLLAGLHAAVGFVGFRPIVASLERPDWVRWSRFLMCFSIAPAAFLSVCAALYFSGALQAAGTGPEPTVLDWILGITWLLLFMASAAGSLALPCAQGLLTLEVRAALNHAIELRSRPTSPADPPTRSPYTPPRTPEGS